MAAGTTRRSTRGVPRGMSRGAARAQTYLTRVGADAKVPESQMSLASQISSRRLGRHASRGSAQGVFGAYHHFGISCDECGVCPIVGMRYTIPNENRDLCEKDFWDQPTAEQQR